MCEIPRRTRRGASWGPMLLGKIHAVSHHKCGNTHSGYYCVEFSFADIGTKWRMIATLLPGRPLDTRVTCINDSTQQWRGDLLYNTIMGAVSKAVQSGELDPESTLWGHSMLNLMQSFPKPVGSPVAIAMDGYPIEKYDGLLPGDHGTDTP